ncbi:MAG: UDP-N-acetylmuramoyl-L-alanyl-D-glutamate--2,6-diaminopimelate ligase [Candidatus Cloacimonadales bacterium]
MRGSSQMTKEKIVDLLKEITLETKLDNFTAAQRPVTDTRKISPNDIFICISGYQFDGHDFAEQALAQGASLLICERLLKIELPQIVVSDTRQATALLAKDYYDDPSSKLKLIGVTGTNGKTTVAHIFYQTLLQMGQPVGMIGTLGYKIADQLFPTERTTPDIIELNQILQQMVKAKIEYVILEVSSHALALNRVDYMNFSAAIFTNLTQDHLDFHASLDEYAATKFRLFHLLRENSGLALINLDDKYGKILYAKEHTQKLGISFQDGDITIKNSSSHFQGSRFSLVRNGQYQHFKTKMIGEYNIFNLAITIALIAELFPQYDLEKLQAIIANLGNVPGRLEIANSKPQVGVYVDYAHSPDALQNVLSTLSKLKKRRLICVFGAGGDRDSNKRPEMMKAALRADLVIITTDNPRSEDPANIIREIISQQAHCEKFWILQDRKEAILSAIALAHPGDIVLIAGKGHEKYQEVRGEKLYFDDLEIAESYQDRATNLAIPIDALMLEVIFNSKLENTRQIYQAISTDSRTMTAESIFFALQGENFDGNQFVERALQNKNCLAIVNSEYQGEAQPIIRVKDTTRAYGKLASIYKKLFAIKSIAITGSYGKTTTKEYLYNILNQVHPTLKTFSNENNLVGLPKTIFQLSTLHHFAVFELGTNHFGEIKALSDIAQADINAITSIGPSHLEFLIDEAGVFQEKTSIFRGQNEIRIFPGDDLRFANLNGITFGQKAGSDYQINNIQSHGERINFQLNNLAISLATPFRENVYNAALAATIAAELKIDPEFIQSGLSLALEIKNRMQFLHNSRQTIISDCYNANPNSMKAALNFANSYQPTRPHIAIIGDMLELGELTEKYHKDIWKCLKTVDFQQVIAVGPFSIAYDADHHFHSVEALLDSQIYQDFPPESIILVKASRSIQLEKIVEKILQK